MAWKVCFCITYSREKYRVWLININIFSIKTKKDLEPHPQSTAEAMGHGGSYPNPLEVV